MTKIISFANQKGGVGKSTLCIQMTFFLLERGHKVLVIDMDGQGNTSSRLALDPGEEEARYYGTKTSELFAKKVKKIEFYWFFLSRPYLLIFREVDSGKETDFY